MKSVLVIGAGGFLGKRVVECLGSMPGVTVVAGVRRDTPEFRRKNVECRICDASDVSAVTQALNGVTHVVNCVMGDGPVIVSTAEILSQAALSAGASLIHLSSIAVYGDADGYLSEDRPLGGGDDWYGEAKISAEAAILKAAEQGLSAVILRPALIYGPGSTLWTSRIARLLLQRRLGDLGAAGDGICNLVHVRDVARCVAASLDKAAPEVPVVNVCQANPPTWNEYLMRFARCLGATPVRRIPGWQLRLERKLVAIPLRVLQIVFRRVPSLARKIPDPVTPGIARLFDRRVGFDVRRAAMLLGGEWTPLDEGMVEAADWFLGSR